MNAKSPGGEAADHNGLVVQVRYLAAAKPFVEPKVDGSQLVSTLKAMVLEFFGLAEGDVEGGRKEYAFSLDGVQLTNLQVSLESLAAGKHRIEFKLLEQFIQG